MSTPLNHITLKSFPLKNGNVQDISVSYQLYGCVLHTAPIVLVNHALTGNSAVQEWWSQQVGAGKTIDSDRFTVLSINIPGNGYDGVVDHFIYNYKDWTLSDVATVFIETLKQLRICYLHLGIGGSIGGALLWEMTVKAPELFGTIMPIAADWKSTDWLVACCHVQQAILEDSAAPLEHARKHAMTFYRSPQSLKHKFNRAQENGFQVQHWLDYHGTALKNRFTLPAYKLLNHLLTTIDVTRNFQGNLLKAVETSETRIAIVSINSDGFFVPQEDQETYELLAPFKNVTLDIIDSIHGHDAFLMEHSQVAHIIKKHIEVIVTEQLAKPCY